MVEVADRVARFAGGLLDRVVVEAVGALVAPQNVVAATAHQRVVAAAAEQIVVALVALDDVGVVVARKPVAVFRAAQILEVAEGVALGMAADRPAGVEIGDHAGIRAKIAQPVDALAAVEQVAAGAAADGVVAEPAVERVDGAVAGDHVVCLVPITSSTDQ